MNAEDILDEVTNKKIHGWATKNEKGENSLEVYVGNYFIQIDVLKNKCVVALCGERWSGN